MCNRVSAADKAVKPENLEAVPDTNQGVYYESFEDLMKVVNNNMRGIKSQKTKMKIWKCYYYESRKFFRRRKF